MHDAFRNVAIGAVTMCCAVIVALLSFISMELSVAVFAVGSLVYVISAEHKRRINWEQSAEFKILKMNKRHDALAKTVKDRFEPADRIKGEALAKTASETKAAMKKSAAANIRKTAISFDSLVNDAPRKKDAIKPKPIKLSVPANLPKEEMFQRRAPKISVIEDAESLSDMVVEELMGHAISQKRIDIFMQPILRMPQRQRKFYELYSRVRAKPGVYIPAKRYLKLAEKNAQIKDIDALLLAQCLDMAKSSQNMTDAPAFFVNITASTLQNGQFMSKLLGFLTKNRDLAGRLVFEMSQAEFHALNAPVLKIVSGLAKLGCAFSLDHVTRLDEDISDLQRFRVRYLKVDAAMFVKAAKNDRSYKEIMKAKRALEGNGIGLIAEKIEDEATMRILLDFDLHYGQGYLFGRPDVQGAYEPQMPRKQSA